MSKESGVMNIKKKVAQLKQELDEANDRASCAETSVREKDEMVDKVCTIYCLRILILLH